MGSPNRSSIPTWAVIGSGAGGPGIKLSGPSVPKIPSLPAAADPEDVAAQIQALNYAATQQRIERSQGRARAFMRGAGQPASPYDLPYGEMPPNFLAPAAPVVPRRPIAPPVGTPGGAARRPPTVQLPPAFRRGR
jgi:hypothetical protein